MACNHLEQLISEWYDWKGYIVRRNVKVGKRTKGGYEGELDVVAFHPAKNHLVHVEPSTDTQSWSKREVKFKRKFEAGEKYIPKLFDGFTLPPEIEQYAVLVQGSKANHQTVGGKKFILVGELLQNILKDVRKHGFLSSAVSEQWPILRTLQLVLHCRKSIDEP
jgi:hypothetical protein